jgi:hypothetical protein
MIDMVLVEKRWQTTVRNFRTYEGAEDITSDHNLVLCIVKMQLKKVCNANRKPIRDIAALQREDVQFAYCNKLQEGLEEGSPGVY